MTTERCRGLRLVACANQPYRPANGSEGAIFRHHFCDRCSKDDVTSDRMCPILTATLIYGDTDPRYPKEWHYDAEGYPFCEAFEERTGDSDQED